jgi:hypothetical protein
VCVLRCWDEGAGGCCARGLYRPSPAAGAVGSAVAVAGFSPLRARALRSAGGTPRRGETRSFVHGREAARQSFRVGTGGPV